MRTRAIVGTSWWIYENWTHERARLHTGDCSFCRDGQGTQASRSNRNGRWLGPFTERAAAVARLERLRRADTALCGTCRP